MCGAESPQRFISIIAKRITLIHKEKIMEILKDLVKEHPVVAGIALVAVIAINAMVEAERIVQK